MIDPITLNLIYGQGEMSAPEGTNQSSEKQRARRRLPTWVVAALWVVAAIWIAIDPLTGAHSSTTSRWMQNVSLLLVAAACTTLIAWLIQYLIIEPYNSKTRSFELGYFAGCSDTLNKQRPSLSVVVNAPEATDRTGT